MNGIEKITTRILDDAQAEIDEVLSRAEAEAASIRARYESQAKHDYEESTRRGAERAREREENLAGASLLEARKETLNAKQKMLDKAFFLAAEKLRGLSDQDYLSLLASLAAAASLSGTEAVVLSPDDREKFGNGVVRDANGLLTKAGKRANLTLSSETRATGGGLLLSDGQIETNCTFDTLLRLVRTELSGEVAATLFE